MALIYDGFLLLGVTFGYGVFVWVLRRLSGTDMLSAPSDISQIVTLLGLYGCCSLFYVWSWRKSGQTLGMKSWRIQLRNRDGSVPSLQTCLLRCLVAPPLNLGIFGLLWCLLDRQGDSLPDRLTGTRSLLVPKPVKRAASSGNPS